MMTFPDIDEAIRQTVLDQLLDVNACLEVTGCKRERLKYLVRKGDLVPAKTLTNGDRLFWLSDALKIRDKELQEAKAKSEESGKLTVKKKDRRTKIPYSEIIEAAIGSASLSGYTGTVEQFLAKHPELREKLEDERAEDPPPSKSIDGGPSRRKPGDRSVPES